MTVINPRSDQSSARGFDNLDSLLCVQQRLQSKASRRCSAETSVEGQTSQDYTHPDDRTLLYDMTPGFKPFTI